jgi:hypothetical protein
MMGGSIVSLTTIDEVPDKIEFLNGISDISTIDTNILISARNSDWLLSSNKNIISINNDIMNDLNVQGYSELFSNNGFEILKIVKLPRPVITSFTINGIKTAIIVILEFFLPLNKCYMLGYHIKKMTSND